MKKPERGSEAWFRAKLLSWHYNKARTISILDLLQSNYQGWRRQVERRAGEAGKVLDFREAIKKATFEELQKLQYIRDEEKIDK